MQKYHLEDEDLANLEDVLQFAQRIADLQYDDDMADAIQTTILEVARAFGVTCTKMTVEADEAGNYIVTTEQEDTPKPRPSLRIVSDRDREDSD